MNFLMGGWGEGGEVKERRGLGAVEEEKRLEQYYRRKSEEKEEKREKKKKKEGKRGKKVKKIHIKERKIHVI